MSGSVTLSMKPQDCCSWMMSLYIRSFSGSAARRLTMERVLCLVISAFDGRGGCSGRHGNLALYRPSSSMIDVSW